MKILTLTKEHTSLYKHAIHVLYVYRYLPNVYTRSVFLSEYLTRGRGLNRQYLIRGGWLCIKSWNYITLQYRYICVFICPLISFMFQNYYIFSILIVYIDVSTILTVLKSGFQIYKGAKYFSRRGGAKAPLLPLLKETLYKIMNWQPRKIEASSCSTVRPTEPGTHDL